MHSVRKDSAGETVIDRDLSALVAHGLGDPRGECFRHSVAALDLEIQELEGAVYVEGYAGEDVTRFPHGWLELPGGRIVDPTMRLSAYRAVARFSREEIRRRRRFGLELPITETLRVRVTRRDDSR